MGLVGILVPTFNAYEKRELPFGISSSPLLDPRKLAGMTLQCIFPEGKHCDGNGDTTVVTLTQCANDEIVDQDIAPQGAVYEANDCKQMAVKVPGVPPAVSPTGVWQDYMVITGQDIERFNEVYEEEHSLPQF